jgi:hypothetical protein
MHSSRQLVEGERRQVVLRRLDWLKAAAAVAIVPRHVLGGPGHVPPSEKVVLAGIGMGGQGMQNLTNFLEIPEIQVTAVCDVNRESGGYISANWNMGKEQKTAGREPALRAVEEFYAQQRRSGKYRGCHAYADYRELLAKEKIDAVMRAPCAHLVERFVRGATTNHTNYTNKGQDGRDHSR